MSWEEAPLRMDDSKVEIADDYTKRKCVFRLKTSSGSECLFQAESDASLSHWVSVIEDTLRHQTPQSNSSNQKTSTHYQFSHFPIGSATASPNAYSPQVREDTETNHAAANEEAEDNHKKNSSAPTSGKADRKLTIGSRNRSPTGSSPKEKSRKASAGKIYL